MKKTLSIICFVLTLFIFSLGNCDAYAEAAPSQPNEQEQGDENESSGDIFGSSVALVAVGGGGAIAVNSSKRKKAGGKKKTAVVSVEQKRDISRASTATTAADKENKLDEKVNA